MKFQSLALAVFASVFLSACGGGGSLTLEAGANGILTVSGKPLASNWQESNNLYSLDFRQLQFGLAMPSLVTMQNGQTCTCEVVAGGTESSGTLSTTNCVGTYAQCSQFNGNTTFTKNADGMRMCTASVCADLN